MALKSLHPRLPAELTDMVIDHLRDDRKTLSATSLAARAWLPRSRVHKFSQLCVESDFEGLRADLVRAPHLRPYVRKLVLQGPSPYGADPFTADAMLDTADDADADDADAADASHAPRPVLAPRLLGELLALLPHLRELQLHRVSLHARAERAAPRGAQYRLARLTLMHVGGPRDMPGDVLRVLAFFGALGALHLEGVAHAWAPATPPPAPHAARVRVGALRLENAGGALLLDGLRAAVVPPALRALEAEITDGGDAVAFARMLAEAGPALAHVAVDLRHCFCSDGNLASSPQLIADTLAAGLGTCTGLRSAEIVVPADAPEEGGEDAPADVADAWACAARTLARLPRSTEKLAIRLSAGAWDEQVPLARVGLDWAMLRGALAPLAGLRSLTIGLAHDDAWWLEPADAAFLRQELAEWAEKDVLHVEVGLEVNEMDY